MSQWAKTFLGLDTLLFVGAIVGIFIDHNSAARIASGVAALVFFLIAAVIIWRPQTVEKDRRQP